VLCDAVRKLHDNHCGVNELEIYCGCVATGAIHGAAHGTAYQELFILTIGAFCGTALLAHAKSSNSLNERFVEETAHGTGYQELFILTIGAFCGTALLAHITESILSRSRFHKRLVGCVPSIQFSCCSLLSNQISRAMFYAHLQIPLHLLLHLVTHLFTHLALHAV
jgi:hypothetical protein